MATGGRGIDHRRRRHRQLHMFRATWSGEVRHDHLASP